MSQSSGPRPSDRFIPLYIVAFFVAQAVAFSWFYHIATSTYTGVVTENAYEKGLKYNDVIAETEREAKLGWHADISKADGGLRAVLKDKDGQPLTGAKVRLWLVRPVQDGIDQHLNMTETAPGTYFVAATARPGLWDTELRAERQGVAWQTSKRLEF
jgi:nitrogen fixation protein FixH